jgi:hypothetical protein
MSSKGKRKKYLWVEGELRWLVSDSKMVHLMNDPQVISQFWWPHRFPRCSSSDSRECVTSCFRWVRVSAFWEASLARSAHCKWILPSLQLAA